MRLSILVVVILIIPVFAYSATIEVPKDYTTIQAAIDAAATGDTVLVAPGTYVETIDFKGKAINVKSSGGPEVTVIDGNYSGSVVKFTSNEKLDSVLDGFSITKGSDGGIRCFTASPTIKNNTIFSNIAYNGGGIYCHKSSSPVITDNIISGNSASFGGGGICCEHSSSPTVKNNKISGNSAPSGFGGGICCWSVADIANNIISWNSSGIYGGGICIEYYNPKITNNIIYGNFATTGKGGGIYCRKSLSQITNNTIVGNSADSGGGMTFDGSFIPIITNTIIRDNTAQSFPEIEGSPIVTYCNIKGGFVGTGNIDASPLFVDPAVNDYHLTFNSPCKDSADNTGVNELTDFEGDPRIAHGKADMGADEFHTHLYYTGNASPGGAIDLKFIDLPNVTPVIIWIGSGILDPPFHSKKYGDFYLLPPLLAQLSLGIIPPPDGVLSIPLLFGPNFPAMEIPMQAMIGKKLSNLCVIKIK